MVSVPEAKLSERRWLGLNLLPLGASLWLDLSLALLGTSVSFHLSVSRLGASLLCDESEILLKRHGPCHDPFDGQLLVTQWLMKEFKDTLIGVDKESHLLACQASGDGSRV